MIDIENIVVDELNTILAAAYPSSQYPGLVLYADYVSAPASFPCVTVVCEDNYTLERTQDENLAENHAVMMFSVNVYSSKASGAKSEAKMIFQTVDEAMQNMKFTRTMCSPIPNVDRTIYRITARYEIIVAKGVTDGDDTVYQTYRR